MHENAYNRDEVWGRTGVKNFCVILKWRMSEWLKALLFQ